METMKSGTEVIAVIPARGGSKGLPGKNIRELCGKPLVAYSIEVALRSELVDRVVLSTDSEIIADIGREYGAEVPFLRPATLATDGATIGAALDHLMGELYGETWRQHNALVTLYPTSPFRTPGLVDYLITKLFEGYSHVSAAKRLDSNGYDYFVRSNGSFRALFSNSGCMAKMYRNYGIFSGFAYAYPSMTYCHYIDNPACFIDIDYLEDFMVAEEIIRRGLFDFSDFSRPAGNGGGNDECGESIAMPHRFAHSFSRGGGRDLAL